MKTPGRISEFVDLQRAKPAALTGCSIDLYWFSGSGNTLIATLALVDEFRQNGIDIRLRPIETSLPESIDPDVVFGLAFPTHCFTLPEMVRQFALRLPEVDGTPAFMLTTAGALSGGVHGPLKKILAQKGFDCRGARQLMMPDSFFAFIHGKIAQKMIASAQKKSRIYAHHLMDGTASWKRFPGVSDLIASFCRRLFAKRKLLKKTPYPGVYAKEKACVKCNRCVDLCPVKALTKATLLPPQPLLHCTLCLRCVAVCPEDAMRLRLLGLRPYRAGESDELTQLIKRTIQSGE